MIIAATTTTATTASFTISGAPADATQIEVQYGGTRDLMFCLAPSFVIAKANFTLVGLNQRSRYFTRARPVAPPDEEPDDWSPVVATFTDDGAARDFSSNEIAIQPAIIMPCDPVMTWTSQQARAGYPADALGIDAPGAIWIGDQAGGIASFEMELSGSPVDTIGLLGSNAPEDATVTIKGGASLANVRGGSPSYSLTQAFRASPNMPQRSGYHSLIRLAAAVRHRFLRVEIAGTFAGGAVALTHACVGRARITRNLSANKTETPTDTGSLQRDRTGSPNRVRGYRGRTVDFDLSLLTEEQYEREYADLPGLIGSTDPVLVVPNSRQGAALHDRILYGTLSQARNTNPYTKRFNQSFSFDSLI